jgi:hypothetical protein
MSTNGTAAMRHKIAWLAGVRRRGSLELEEAPEERRGKSEGNQRTADGALEGGVHYLYSNTHQVLPNVSQSPQRALNHLPEWLLRVFLGRAVVAQAGLRGRGARRHLAGRAAEGVAIAVDAVDDAALRRRTGGIIGAAGAAGYGEARQCRQQNFRHVAVSQSLRTQKNRSGRECRAFRSDPTPTYWGLR